MRVQERSRSAALVAVGHADYHPTGLCPCCLVRLASAGSAKSSRPQHCTWPRMGASPRSDLQVGGAGGAAKVEKENMSAMDLVIGVYARNKHLQDIVLILGSQINQEPRMEVWMAGRNPNCDLVIQHRSIHGFHFELEVDKVSRRAWVTNLTLTGKLSVVEIVIRPQCIEQFYPGEILKVGDSSRSFKLEVIPSVSSQEERSYDSKHHESYMDGSAPRAMQQLCEKIIETIDGLQAK
ncbi:FHA domain-containing protein [Nymphaea thermarum]|nr:FHA domain-containing protein [Nymphaea thermarum]